MDAATADFHSLGAPALRAAIEHADELEAALLARTQELESAGYHAQVLITPATRCSSSSTPRPARASRCGALRRQPRQAGRPARGSTPPPNCSPSSTPNPSASAPTRCCAPSFRTPSCPPRPTSAAPPRSPTSRSPPSSTSRSSAASRPAAPPLRHAGRTRHRRHVWPRRGLSPRVLEAKTIEALASAPRRARHAHRGQAQTRRRRQRHGRRPHAPPKYIGRARPRPRPLRQVSASKMRYQMDRLRRMAATFELQGADQPEQTRRRHHAAPASPKAIRRSASSAASGSSPHGSAAHGDPHQPHRHTSVAQSLHRLLAHDARVPLLGVISSSASSAFSPKSLILPRSPRSTVSKSLALI